jgi:hypothetical protein
MKNITYTAILFDTRSIQQYIFSGNKLRTNIGASYIVDHIFDIELTDVLQMLFPGQCDTESWKNEEGIVDFAAACRVAYIGGGNALVLFQDTINIEMIKNVVTAFTKKLLVLYPGLKTGAAIGRLDLSSPACYKATNTALYKVLKGNQNTIFPQVNVNYTGFTLLCDVSGETADYEDTAGIVGGDKGSRFYSQEVAAKSAKAKEANMALQEEFQKEIQNFIFPGELDKLGQPAGKDYIAVVHVDGNNMGIKFSQCQTLAKRTALSKAVSKKTKRAFALLLKYIVAQYDTYSECLHCPTHNGKQYLPVRPLILGGDDITFVCPAQVALIFAKKFMEFMIQKDDELAGSIDCCSGVAIIPTAYPFFRGYEMAEQLCDAAKKRSRQSIGTSWMDFAKVHGEQAPTLEQIREEEYQGVLGNLHFGPYLVGNTENEYSIDKLFDCIQQFNEDDKLARNKIKDLRDVLQRDTHDLKKFMEQVRHRKDCLPEVKGWEQYAENLWYKQKTPYIDAIEMMDFLPKGAK